MRIVKPKVEEIKDFEGVDNFYKAVARAARICYASDKTTDDKELCKRLIEKKHYSPFAHAIIYIRTESAYRNFSIMNNIVYNNKFTIPYKSHTFFAVNGRVIVEEIEKWIGNLELSSGIFEYLETFLANIKTIESPFRGYFKSFIVDTSIGTTREFNRHHDNFYICEQSTRYCNYSKDKFGGEISVNEPYWVIDDVLKDEVYKQAYAEWYESLVSSESKYFNMLNEGVPTDIARGVLPLDTHTRCIYTATIEEWNHIIQMRYYGTTGKPHGDAKIIAGKILNLIEE